MSDIRPSIFAEDSDDDVDLTRFAPKALKPPPVPAADIRRLSEESGFPSRAPSAGDRQTTVSQLSTVGSLPAPVRRPAKTGRTQLLNARVTPKALERYHAIVAAEQQRYEAGEITHKPTLGEIVEMALAALERERAKKGRGA